MTEINFTDKQIAKWSIAIFVLFLVIFAATYADRLLKPSNDNHYVFLADAILNGRFHIEGKPPHRNDWAEYQGKWYVSFPPAPAFLMIPGVAVFGMSFNDRLFSLFFAAAGPALLFAVLALLIRRKSINRKPWEIASVAGLYGIGTVYYFAAVQGSVWYTAHMVGSVFLLMYIWCALDGTRPLLAGLFLGIAFACRPSMLMAFPFIIYEAVISKLDWSKGFSNTFLSLFAKDRLIKTAKTLGLFAVPLVIILCLLMWMNYVRFDNPFEFGHSLLKVRWTSRIEKWGLFNYHYLSRNLAVFGALLPWISTSSPYIQISNHGLAIWFTTPVLFYILWPKARDSFYTALACTAGVIAMINLLYQNSGWVQFGYRFSLDYMAFLLIMVAASGRKFGKLFFFLVAFSIAVNLFGAITFDRVKSVYPSHAPTAYFEPD